MIFRRPFSTNYGQLFSKVILKNAKSKSVSSQEWLNRQLTDPYVEKSKMMNYRCRSAFKLTEIDDKYHILKPGQVVIDCGAAPGSWTQVAAQRCNAQITPTEKSHGTVIGIDKLQIFPIEGAHLLGKEDFTMQSTQQKILKMLDNRKVNVMLSDMAPNATGVRSMDQDQIIDLCYSVLRLAVQISHDNATILVKVWDGGDVPKLQRDFEKFYKNVKFIKPHASRMDSSEKFMLGRGFKGLK